MKITPVRVAIVAIAVLALVLYWKRPRVASTGSDACNSDGADALSVLFIGNSHTFVNDLPDMFCRLASPEQPVRVSSVVGPGWSLSMHWDDGRALRAIREQGPWSFVVLQDQSGMPLARPALFADTVRKFDGEVRAVGGKSVLYELWPRRDVEQDARELHRRYSELARKEGLLRVPVGPAWLAALERHPGLPLYQPDGLHAQPAGTYLAACVFFAALLRKSPEHRPVFAGVDGKVALELQSIAWRSLNQP